MTPFHRAHRGKSRTDCSLRLDTWLAAMDARYTSDTSPGTAIVRSFGMTVKQIGGLQASGSSPIYASAAIRNKPPLRSGSTHPAQPAYTTPSRALGDRRLRGEQNATPRTRRHHGHAKRMHTARAIVLDTAYQRHPERFVRKPPTPPQLPTDIIARTLAPMPQAKLTSIATTMICAVRCEHDCHTPSNTQAASLAAAETSRPLMFPVLHHSHCDCVLVSPRLISHPTFRGTEITARRTPAPAGRA